ncbi:hypothetical protein FOA20_15690 [Peribacillus simplex]
MNGIPLSTITCPFSITVTIAIVSFCNSTISASLPVWILPYGEGRVTANYPVCESILEIQERIFILEVIKQYNDKGKAASRELIASQSQESDFVLSPPQIRRRLDILEIEGFVVKGRGRAGTKITAEGMEYLYFLKSKHALHGYN